MKPTKEQLDRAIGAILASAAGDALGAPYEFKPPMPAEEAIEMEGGGSFGWAPGEWTDDTSMAIPILMAIANGKDLASEATQGEIVEVWRHWANTAPDVGIQTRSVLANLNGSTAAAAQDSAKKVHDLNGRSGGNGSLMRTAPVALAALDSAQVTAASARALSSLTHYEEDAGDACVLWCLAIRNSILTGEVDVRLGLSALAPDRQALWRERIEVAETHEPAHFENNGWVVAAFQAAWSAITRATSLEDGLERAVRAGYDTDTVAAIAGGILGAKFGASAIPVHWRSVMNGWPGLVAADLEALVTEALK
jgi:ADP-ribosyl-[dinitrogen reductase] hydrolase